MAKRILGVLSILEISSVRLCPIARYGYITPHVYHHYSLAMTPMAVLDYLLMFA